MQEPFRVPDAIRPKPYAARMPKAWTYGDVLKQMRQARGLTQSQAAQKVGVELGAYGGWERSCRRMMVSSLACSAPNSSRIHAVPPESIGLAASLQSKLTIIVVALVVIAAASVIVAIDAIQSMDDRGKIKDVVESVTEDGPGGSAYDECMTDSDTTVDECEALLDE